MPGSWISYALLGALATALLAAAVTDLRRREIDNWLNLAIALSAPLYWLASGLGWVAVLFQVALAVLTFMVACALYAMRQMGGGDVKLLTALALWFVPGSFVQLVIIMGVIGGAASIAMAVFNMRRLPTETLRNGLSTLVAALWVLGACAIFYAAVTGKPIVSAQAWAALQATVPGGWPLAILALATAAVFMTGLRHIFRRQRGAIPIPYGVAISAAALSVMVQETVSGPFFSALHG